MSSKLLRAATQRHTIKQDSVEYPDRTNINFNNYFDIADNAAEDSTDIALTIFDDAGLITLTNNTGSLSNSRQLVTGSHVSFNLETDGELAVNFVTDRRYILYEDNFMWRIPNGKTIEKVSGSVGDLNWTFETTDVDQTIEPATATSEIGGGITLNCAQDGWTLMQPSDDSERGLIKSDNIKSIEWIINMGDSIDDKKVYLGFAADTDETQFNPNVRCRMVYDSVSGSTWLFETSTTGGDIEVNDTTVNAITGSTQRLKIIRQNSSSYTAEIDGVSAISNIVNLPSSSFVNYGLFLSSSNATAGNRQLDVNYFALNSVKINR